MIFVYTGSLNEYVTYLHLPEYLIIAVGMAAVTFIITRKFNRRLFGESDRKNLRRRNG
jgi:cell division protein FtsL